MESECSKVDSSASSPITQDGFCRSFVEQAIRKVILFVVSVPFRLLLHFGFVFIVLISFVIRRRSFCFIVLIPSIVRRCILVRLRRAWYFLLSRLFVHLCSPLFDRRGFDAIERPASRNKRTRGDLTSSVWPDLLYLPVFTFGQVVSRKPSFFTSA